MIKLQLAHKFLLYLLFRTEINKSKISKKSDILIIQTQKAFLLRCFSSNKTALKISQINESLLMLTFEQLVILLLTEQVLRFCGTGDLHNPRLQRFVVDYFRTFLCLGVYSLDRPLDWRVDISHHLHALNSRDAGSFLDLLAHLLKFQVNDLAKLALGVIRDSNLQRLVSGVELYPFVAFGELQGWVRGCCYLRISEQTFSSLIRFVKLNNLRVDNMDISPIIIHCFGSLQLPIKQLFLLSMHVQQTSQPSDCPQSYLIGTNTLTIGGKKFAYCVLCQSYHQKPHQKLDGKQYLLQPHTLKTTMKPATKHTGLQKTIEQHTEKLHLGNNLTSTKKQLALEEYRNPSHWKVFHGERQNHLIKDLTAEKQEKRSSHERNPSMGSESKIHSLGKHLNKGSMKELRGIALVQNEQRRPVLSKNDFLGRLGSTTLNPEYQIRQKKLSVESAQKIAQKMDH